MTRSQLHHRRVARRIDLPHVNPRGHIIRHLLVLAIVVTLVGWGRCAAAQPADPFGTLAVEAGGLTQVNRTSLHDYWAPPFGIAASVAMPFYCGRIRGSIEHLSYDSRVGGLTDFRGRHVFVEWSMPVRLLGGLYAEGGGRLGVFQMHFDDEGHEQARDEQEVAAGLVAGLIYRTPWRWAVHVRASHVTVRLVRPLTQTFVSAGVSYTFGTPDWLQEALR